MTTDNHAKDQAAAQLASIHKYLAALTCDFDRFEELRYIRKQPLNEWAQLGYDADEWAELEAAAGDCESQEDAQQRIQEDPLSVQVRSGWVNVGETFAAEEFEILLCTGGPAVRIMGELDEHNQPSRAFMQYQDWGTSWTDYFEEGVAASCLEYAQQFYFGD
jgi:hypothetical protein